MNPKKIRTCLLLSLGLLSTSAVSLTSCDIYNNKEEVKTYISEINKNFEEKTKNSRYKNYDFVRIIPEKYIKKLQSLPKNSRDSSNIFEDYKKEITRQLDSNSKFKFYYDDEEFYVIESKADVRELYCIPCKTSKEKYVWEECNKLANNYYKNYKNMLSSRLLTDYESDNYLSRNQKPSSSSFWLSTPFKDPNIAHLITRSDGKTGFINPNTEKNALRPLCVFVPNLNEYNKELKQDKDALLFTLNKGLDESLTYKELKDYSFYSTIKPGYEEAIKNTKTISKLDELGKNIKKDVNNGNFKFKLKNTEFRLLKNDSEKNELLVIPSKVVLKTTFEDAYEKAIKFADEYDEISSSSMFNEEQAQELLLDNFITINTSYWIDNSIAYSNRSTFIETNFLIEKSENTRSNGLLPLCVIKK